MFPHNVLVKKGGILHPKDELSTKQIQSPALSIQYFTATFLPPWCYITILAFPKRPLFYQKGCERYGVSFIFYVCVSYETHRKNVSFIITVKNRMYTFQNSIHFFYTLYPMHLFYHFLYLLEMRLDRSLPRRHWLTSIKTFQLFRAAIK